MKKTSKILIGAGIALFVPMVVGILCLAFLAREGQYSRTYTIAWKDLSRQKVEKGKYLEIFSDTRVTGFELTVRPLPEGEVEPFLEYPAELKPYVHIQPGGDTLWLSLLQLDPLLEAHHTTLIEGAGAVLYVPDDMLEGIHGESGTNCRLKGLRVDRTLTCDGHFSCWVDSSRISHLDYRSAARIYIVGSRLDTLTRDLSSTRGGWLVYDGSRIDVLQLRAHSEETCEVDGIDVGEVRWLPQGEDARLRIKFGNEPVTISLRDKQGSEEQNR
ncbi:MAG: hypothetical protein ACOYJE_09610 [Bacteroidaceae bacterium]|jgi:hypothetical protein